MKEVVIAIGEKVTNKLNLPGFGSFITIGALTLLVAIVSILRKERNKLFFPFIFFL